MITPLEIENKKFSKQMMNGYSVEEVDDFLDQVTEELEKKCKELSTTNKEVEQLKKELEHYKGMESTLQNTFLFHYCY